MIFALMVNGKKVILMSERLVDVNKLMTDYGMSTECKDCKRESECDSILLMWRDVCEMLDDAPTVDAIPISYIRDWIERHPTDCNTVEGMLMDWREEGMNGV